MLRLFRITVLDQRKGEGFKKQNARTGKRKGVEFLYMAKYTGPKFRLDRREGVNMQLKGKRSSSGKHPLDKKGPMPPGQHGPHSRGRLSGYGIQLREKQKAKRMYGMFERQFQRYYHESMRRGGKGEELLRLLETRLDNVVYRLGFALSRYHARQMVNHGHILVNGKKVSIPSYEVKVGEVISLKEKAQNLPNVKEAIEGAATTALAEWLERKAIVGKVKRKPTREELPSDINENLIIEYYSR